jgi:hypothetical protein
MNAMGRTRCAIAEGHIPSQSSFTDRALVSHETACILNAGGSDAHVALTIFFADRETGWSLSDHRAGTPYVASAFQRSCGAIAGSARHRFFFGI